MSEITRGAIMMPYELAMSSELSRRQFHSIAQALLTERDQISDELSACKEGPGTCGYWREAARLREEERDQLKAESEESSAVIDQLAKILAGVAVALKGEELPLSRHSYHDLVKCVTVLKLENDLRKAENEALNKDAERYRWLRNGPDDLDLSEAENMEEVDALIDSAMSKEG